MSLDGMIARTDGSVDWLEDFPAEAFGITEFLANIDAILMGRATFEALRAHDGWLHPGKRTVVVTSQPVRDAPGGVEACRDGLAAAVASLEADGHRHVWVEGGGQVVRGLLALGRLDVLEMAVIPVVLGEGIPLFPAGTPPTGLTLRHAEAKSGGALHLMYHVAAP